MGFTLVIYERQICNAVTYDFFPGEIIEKVKGRIPVLQLFLGIF